MDEQNLGKSSTGIEANVAGLLCYVLGFITGLIFLLIEKENKFVKFHAVQSIALSVVLFVINIVLMFIPIIGWLLLMVFPLAIVVLWIILMVKAYQGQWFRLPVIGDIAAKQAGVTS